jgi:hypothetical protein
MSWGTKAKFLNCVSGVRISPAPPPADRIVGGSASGHVSPMFLCRVVNSIYHYQI